MKFFVPKKRECNFKSNQIKGAIRNKQEVLDQKKRNEQEVHKLIF